MGKSPFTVCKEHVYGHQDVTGRPMTQLEQLNCKVDALAKDIALLHIQSMDSLPIPHCTSLGYGSIACSGQIITRKIQTTLYKHITGK